MRQPMSTLALGAALLVLAACGGCGMETSDNRMRTRGEMGVPDDRVIKISDTEFVCPHLVTINNRTFSPAEVQRGEVEGAFGPFVPCGTVVPAGRGECPSCGQPYRTSGPGGESEPPLALPKVMSPYSDAPIDLVAIQVKGSQDPRAPDRLAYNMDPASKRYYETAPGDLLTTVGTIEEVLAPNGRPFDPTDNGYKDGAETKVARLVDAIEGPCWRCGGTGLCLECNGSGNGTLGLYGASPPDCWACMGDGRCSECKGGGFVAYEGGLPGKFSMWRVSRDAREPLPSASRNWQHAAEEEAPAAAPRGDGPEAPETPR